MANKMSKISIKPMNNAAAIASTLGISAPTPLTAENTEKGDIAVEAKMRTDNQNIFDFNQTERSKKTKSKIIARVSRRPTEELFKFEKGREADNPENSSDKETNKTGNSSPEVLELPMLIDIKRRFPGKELFVLSLLYQQRNKRGLVQMTVNSMMTLYSMVFEDVIKDDTVRRSLKRLSDAGFIKTTGIPGNNLGYIYEIENLLQTGGLTDAEREEFDELTQFVKRKLNI